MRYKKSALRILRIKIAALCSLLSIIFLGSSSTLKAQISFQKGQRLFQQRAARADSFRADPQVINEAINALNESIRVNYRPREAATLLLQAYYFKGRYADLPDDKRKKAFDQARALGINMRERYPKSAAIAYWYGVNLRQWDHMHNLWQTTINRTDKKLRDTAQSVIALDSTYYGGGGFRLLAKIHFDTPSIWLIKGWPSDEKALEFIRKAVKVAPKLPENRLFYARMLIRFGRKSEAKTQLEHIDDIKSRANHPVQDRFIKYRARPLWQNHLVKKEEDP